MTHPPAKKYNPRVKRQCMFLRVPLDQGTRCNRRANNSLLCSEHEVRLRITMVKRWRSWG